MMALVATLPAAGSGSLAFACVVVDPGGLAAFLTSSPSICAAFLTSSPSICAAFLTSTPTIIAWIHGLTPCIAVLNNRRFFRRSIRRIFHHRRSIRRITLYRSISLLTPPRPPWSRTLFLRPTTRHRKTPLHPRTHRPPSRRRSHRTLRLLLLHNQQIRIRIRASTSRRTRSSNRCKRRPSIFPTGHEESRGRCEIFTA